MCGARHGKFYCSSALVDCLARAAIIHPSSSLHRLRVCHCLWLCLFQCLVARVCEHRQSHVLAVLSPDALQAGRESRVLRSCPGAALRANASWPRTMHQPSQSSRSAGPSSITLPPPPVFASFALPGYTPDAEQAGDSPNNLVFKTAPSSPFSEPPSPVSPPVLWYTPPTTPQNDLAAPSPQHHPSGQSAESVPPSAPLLVPQALHRPAAGEQANNTTERNQGSDDAFPNIIDVAFGSGFDEDGLSTLEKIYLYARSDSNVHRTFIAHALPSYLEQVTPQEAVEYVLPLIHNLAVDEGLYTSTPLLRPVL